MDQSPRSGAGKPPLALRCAALASTLDRFAMPPMLLAISRDLSTSLAAVVTAAGAYFLAYGALQPFWGALSDRLGVVRTMRVALVLAALATAGSAFVVGVGALVTARTLAGACFGAVIPAGIIYLGDTVSPVHRQRALTGLMSGIALGIALGSASAGLVADHLSWRWMFIGTGAAALGIAVMMRSLHAPHISRRDARVSASLRLIVRSRVALFVLALAFVEGALLLGAVTLLPAAMQYAGASSSAAGVATAVFGTTALLLAPWIGRFSQRVDVSWLIAAGALSLAVACLAIAWGDTVSVGVVAAGLLGAAYVAMHSTLQAWATEVLPAARATVVSLFAGLLFVGSAVAPMAVAGAAEAGRYSAIFAAAAVGAVALGAVGGLGRRVWRPGFRG